MMNRLYKALRHIPAWTLSILTILLILWLTLAPKPLGEVEVPLFAGADKIVHALMFGFLAFVVLLDYRKHHREKCVPGIFICLTFLLVSLFGVAIEFLQKSMQMGRGFEIPDMVADTAGVFIVCLIWKLLLNRDNLNTEKDDREGERHT